MDAMNAMKMDMSGMSGMSGMDMGNSTTESCKISMLWNWYVKNSCIFAKSWHIHTSGQFAGSIIGIMAFTMAIFAVRRGQREFDRLISKRRQNNLHGFFTLGLPSDTLHVTFTEHFVRAILYTAVYGSATLLMLMLMSYNGYVLLFSFLAAWIAYVVIDTDSLGHPSGGLGCCMDINK
ncbi:copper transporter complex subunit Ctr5 [Schizosaccharomyces japonicus yFS275]|uniref:Copper transport protein n=1 Tax=Schizosaccharomyces japonicus (strain yFS275 / FY16936) TaxID=402676 RepID=B6JY34_SCHJY|nr:copper transporter complex subunit Ctr5 [Schizosaccharomyces japonicus yFS275]EEB06452.2 copper transporter complex subunit Ctr5 [Schizosaccharomyces japonicus yFS275]